MTMMIVMTEEIELLSLKNHWSTDCHWMSILQTNMQSLSVPKDDHPIKLFMIEKIS